MQNGKANGGRDGCLKTSTAQKNYRRQRANDQYRRGEQGLHSHEADVATGIADNLCGVLLYSGVQPHSTTSCPLAQYSFVQLNTWILQQVSWYPDACTAKCGARVTRLTNLQEHSHET